MRISITLLAIFAVTPALYGETKPDWLIDPAPYRASVSATAKSLVLENGLVRRVIRLVPNAATVDYQNLVTGEQLLRAVGPEASVTLNGAEFAVGGLEGQPVQNYLKAEWIDKLHDDPAAYHFAGWKEESTTPRFPWKKRPTWLSRDLPWPAPGKTVVLRFNPPQGAAATLFGRAVFEEPFIGTLQNGWTLHVSKRHARSSFINEGKPGEILALPDTAVYAQRPWPKDATTAEVTLDAGDDTQSNAWGPGIALLCPDRVVQFIARPNQACFEVDGTPTAHKFDRERPVHLRVRLDRQVARLEAAQDEKDFKLIATVDCPQAPTALRVGKIGRGGEDFPGADAGKPIRCHITRVVLRAAEPKDAPPVLPRKDLPEVQVHYTVYDSIPLIEKWVTVLNTTDKPVRVDRILTERLKVAETEGIADPNINIELSSLYVESDYAFLAMNAKSANKQAVKWQKDGTYHTQTSYFYEAPVLLEVAPEFGPDTDVAPGGELISVRAFELFRDGTDRERRGLAQRRMYRAVAPWSQENPVMVHLIASDPAAIRRIVDQAAEVGVELIILSFGSGMNLENSDPKYQATFKEVADYAKAKGIAIGAYSLLASRGAATAADNCRGPGNRIRYGVMPCLGSTWGQWYLRQMKDFMANSGFGAFENDGSYPGDTCAAADHPRHHGLNDSQWVQFKAMAELYQWCRANGVYVNVPDWYFLNGSSKTAMGYKEGNWSLPRAEQEIIERQNIYDGTWEKTSSMGWMMVPLTQYQGGGAAATIEPLKDHLPHYEARMADLFGAGVQACYRGPRIYDTDETKELVKKWITFYKRHRQVLDADIVHLRRPDGRDWDGFVHVNPHGVEKALAFFYNPLQETIERDIRVPLYYSGLTGKAKMTREDGPPSNIDLDNSATATVKVTIPARGRVWVLFTALDSVP